MKYRTLAPAKINLTLDVIKKRPDGYHELASIMQCVSLCDDVAIHITRDREIRVKTNLPYLRNPQKNTAFIAAQRFFEAFGIKNPGIAIHIKKNIPVAAGLAGGSADAAAVLLLLNKIFQAGKSVWGLMRVSETVGADVPFCLYQKTALCEGIGEIVTPLALWHAEHIVLATPKRIVSTASVFEKLEIDQIRRHPDTEKAIGCLERKDMSKFYGALYNVLEEVTGADHPVISVFENIMRESGAQFSMMSGSGPTVYGVFAKKEDAKLAMQKLLAHTDHVYLVHTVSSV